MDPSDDSVDRRVLDALTGVEGPEGAEDLVSSGRVRGLEVSGEGDVRFELVLEPGDPPELARDLRRAAAGVRGVGSVRVDVRAAAAAPPEDAPERSASAPSAPASSPGEAADEPGPGDGEAREGPSAEDAPEGGRVGRGRSLPIMGQGGGGAGAGSPAGRDASGSPGDGGSEGPRPTPVDREASSRHPSDAPPLAGVERVVAVSSGKGGVGKSTIATNLAAAWAAAGRRVGLLDADIYGPDIPTMFGVRDRPRMEGEEVIPLEAHGVRLMSIGFLVGEDTPAIWRGPIIMGVVRQFLQQVRWGELDVLVVDLPPGTGDAQLSLVQLVQVDGGVFVTTPQDVAVGGVLKGVKMFERLEVPVAGIVENMRGFVCPNCGESHDIFGSGGGEKLAASLGVPFLGAIPLGTAVREEGDRGIPTVLGRPDSPEARALAEMAERVEGRLARLAEEEGAGAEVDAEEEVAASTGSTGGT